MAASPIESLLPLFDTVQQSKRLHKQNAKKLSQYFTSLKEPAQQSTIVLLLRTIFDQTLLIPKASVYADRTLDFFSLFFAQQNEIFHVVLLTHLSQRVISSQKLVRQRVCQFLQHFLEYAGHMDVEFSLTVYEQMVSLLLTRLQDKFAAVRQVALQALKYLQDPSDPEDPVIKALVSLLETDPSHATRKTIIGSLALTEQTKGSFMRRLRDRETAVRLSVLGRFAQETDVRQFTRPERLEIIGMGLNARSAELVRAAEALLFRWAGLLGHDALKLLSYLHDPAHTRAHHKYSPARGNNSNSDDVFERALDVFVQHLYAHTTSHTPVRGLVSDEVVSACLAKLKAFRFKHFDAPSLQRAAGSEQAGVELRFVLAWLRLCQRRMHLFAFCGLLDEHLPPAPALLQALRGDARRRDEYARLLQALPLLAHSMDVCLADEACAFLRTLLLRADTGEEVDEEVLEAALEALLALHTHNNNSSAHSNRQQEALFVQTVVEGLAAAEGLPHASAILRFVFAHPSGGLAAAFFAQRCFEKLDVPRALLVPLSSPSSQALAHARATSMQAIGGFVCACLQHGQAGSVGEGLGVLVNVLRQVALVVRGEEVVVRAQALRALTDVCMVRTTCTPANTSEEVLALLQEALSPSSLTSPLLQLIDPHASPSATPATAEEVEGEREEEEEDLLCVGLECVCKLLLCGFLPADYFLSPLLTHFFLPPPAHTCAASPSYARAQQVLSVFLHTYLTTPPSGGDDQCVGTRAVCEGLALFVSSFTTFVHDGRVRPEKLHEAVQALLNILLSAAQHSPHAAHAAALRASLQHMQLSVWGNVCKEVLKIGRPAPSNSRRGTSNATSTEGVLVSAYVHLLAALPGFRGVTPEEAGYIRRGLAELKSIADAWGVKKSAVKGLDACLATLEETVNITTPAAPTEAPAQDNDSPCNNNSAAPTCNNNSSNRFATWCWGLSDLLQLEGAGGWDEPSLLEEGTSGARSTRQQQSQGTSARGRRVQVRVVDSDDDDVEEDDDDDVEEDEHDVEVEDTNSEGEREGDHWPHQEEEQGAVEEAKGKELGRSSRRAMVRGQYR